MRILSHKTVLLRSGLSEKNHPHGPHLEKDLPRRCATLGLRLMPRLGRAVLWLEIGDPENTRLRFLPEDFSVT